MKRGEHMTIQIKNLRLRTIIGINEWERKVSQDVIINVTITFDGSRVSKSDDITDTIDYKKITKKIIHFVEKSHFYLLDRMASQILNVVMEDKRIQSSIVEVDKPHALRYTDSVSVTVSSEQSQ
jgi:D-erythro-7,8-dihydroneopterin triphosphate epimerase